MGDTPKIFAELQKTAESSYPGITFTALTPNLKGLESALELVVKEVAVFGAASEAFSQKNINCSIAESINRFQDVMTKARAHNVKVRGYVSCVLGCPYEGAVSPDKVLEVSQRLLDMGCYEISLGDTIGVGQAGSTKRLLDVVMKKIPRENLAVHFHDTYGQALSNILVALDHGIEVLDSSVSGLGGCPYAKGASGNVATEDVLYMLQGLGIQTGVDLNQVIKAGMYIDGVLSRSSQSKVNKALSPKVASS
jgi:hydroxymethylglutaryl-CoA lyase